MHQRRLSGVLDLRRPECRQSSVYDLACLLLSLSPREAGKLTRVR